MPERDRLTEWNDDRGFGFVTPLGGGLKLFAHVSEFPRELRRPQLNDLVTYEPVLDEHGRPQARRIGFLVPARVKHEPHDQPVSVAGLLLAAGFFIALALLVAVSMLPPQVFGVYTVASVVLFAMYARDKNAAQSGAWRTREDRLHLMALLGGWPGALVAQTLLRHKTRKQPFRTIFWATVVANCVLLAMIAATLASPG